MKKNNSINSTNFEQSLQHFAVYWAALVIGYSAILGGITMALPLMIMGIFLTNQTHQWGLTRIETIWVIWSGLYFIFGIVNIAWTSSSSEVWKFVSEYAFYLLILPLVLSIKTIGINEILRIIKRLALPILLIALIFAVVEKFVFGIERISLLTQSPLVFAPMLSIGVFLALIDKPQTPSEYAQALAIWFLAFLLVAYFAGARGAAIAHLGGLILLLFYYFYNPKNSLRKNALYALLVLLMGAMIFVAALYFTAQNPEFGRYYNVSRFVLYGEGTLEYSAHTRILYYQLGVQAIGDAPIMGHGLKESFSAIAPNWPYDTDHGHLHSDLLNHAVGGGVIGLIGYLGILLIPLLALRKNPEPALIFITITIIALILVNGIFVRMFLRPQLAPYVMIVLSAVLILNENGRTAKKSAE